MERCKILAVFLSMLSVFGSLQATPYKDKAPQQQPAASEVDPNGQPAPSVWDLPTEPLFGHDDGTLAEDDFPLLEEEDDAGPALNASSSTPLQVAQQAAQVALLVLTLYMHDSKDGKL